MAKPTKYEYRDLVRIGREYYKDNGFCAVVAVAVAAECGYGKAFHTLRKLGRKTGAGTPAWMYQEALKQLGVDFTSSREHDMVGRTLGTAERDLPDTGTYLLHVNRHIAVYRDGRLIDWTSREWDGKASRRVIDCVYEIH